jgi:excisionase family DNA binding protein
MGTDEINSTKNQGVKKAQGMSNPLSKRLYTLNEAAKYLGRTLWSMRELVWAGKIPIVRDGKRIFIDFNDLESYITKNKMTYI